MRDASARIGRAGAGRRLAQLRALRRLGPRMFPKSRCFAPTAYQRAVLAVTTARVASVVRAVRPGPAFGRQG
eukprot:7284867-Prymnesium_polylepis.1